MKALLAGLPLFVALAIAVGADEASATPTIRELISAPSGVELTKGTAQSVAVRVAVENPTNATQSLQVVLTALDSHLAVAAGGPSSHDLTIPSGGADIAQFTIEVSGTAPEGTYGWSVELRNGGPALAAKAGSVVVTHRSAIVLEASQYFFDGLGAGASRNADIYAFDAGGWGVTLSAHQIGCDHSSDFSEGWNPSSNTITASRTRIGSVSFQVPAGLDPDHNRFRGVRCELRLQAANGASSAVAWFANPFIPATMNYHPLRVHKIHPAEASGTLTVMNRLPVSATFQVDFVAGARPSITMEVAASGRQVESFAIPLGSNFNKLGSSATVEFKLKMVVDGEQLFSTTVRRTLPVVRPKDIAPPDLNEASVPRPPGTGATIQVEVSERWGWSPVKLSAEPRVVCDQQGWPVEADLGGDIPAGRLDHPVGTIRFAIPSNLSGKEWSGKVVTCRVTITHDGESSPTIVPFRIDPDISAQLDYRFPARLPDTLFDTPRSADPVYAHPAHVVVHNHGEHSYTGPLRVSGPADCPFSWSSGDDFRKPAEVAVASAVAVTISGVVVLPNEHPAGACKGPDAASAVSTGPWAVAGPSYHVTHAVGFVIESDGTNGLDLGSLRAGEKATKLLSVSETFGYRGGKVKLQVTSKAGDLPVGGLIAPDPKINPGALQLDKGETKSVRLSVRPPAGVPPGCSFGWLVGYAETPQGPVLQREGLTVDMKTESGGVAELRGKAKTHGLMSPAAQHLLDRVESDGCSLERADLAVYDLFGRTVGIVADAEDLDPMAPKFVDVGRQLVEAQAHVSESGGSSAIVGEVRRSLHDTDDRLSRLLAQATAAVLAATAANAGCKGAQLDLLGELHAIEDAHVALGLGVPEEVSDRSRGMKGAIGACATAGLNALNELYLLPGAVPMGFEVAAGVVVNINPFARSVLDQKGTESARLAATARAGLADVPNAAERIDAAKLAADDQIRRAEAAIRYGVVVQALGAFGLTMFTARSLSRFMTHRDEALLGMELRDSNAG